MSTETHNGWANYPTWNVALWMDNEEGSYLHARELAREVLPADADIDGEERDAAIYDLAESLKAWHEEVTPELEGFTADLHGWAMGHVDWREIAENLIAEVAE